MKIDFELNGRACSREVPGMTRLLDLLREEIGATGAKEGCGEGECGACTVLLEGTPVCSCLVPSVQVIGRKVRTVEGLETSTGLHRIQEAFVEHGAAQCGICTPGFLMMAASMCESKEPVSAESVRESLAGNLCRCTGYQKIVEAVVEVVVDATH
ncbi:MAG: (2Fe-2S)-binding protein [Myxococcota bacterium]|jgi:carbon-monoxide dehydrogenase small subunit|nr:(2Fe-2S)-binding protein [Myxococcota bacterium]